MLSKNSLTKILLPVLVFISAFIFGFQPVKDTDFGWHYRCGIELLSGHPCLQNDYSYFLPDYKAYYPSFLYDGLTAVIYNVTGFLGLSILSGLILGVAALLIFKLVPGPLWFKVLSPLLILLTPGPSLVIGLRPQEFSFLFFLLTLYIIKRSEPRHCEEASDVAISSRLLRRARNDVCYLFLLPPLFILWVNTHIGFISGLLLLPGLFIDEFLKDLAKEKDFPTPRFKLVTLIVFLSGFATLLNPFGVKVYLEIIRHAQAPLGATIAEWVAPPGWLKILVIILSSQLLFLLYFRRKISIFNLFSLVIFTVLAFTGIRNLIFFATLFFIYSGYVIPTFFSQISLRHSGLRSGIQLLICLIPLLFITLNQGHIEKTVAFDTSWENYCTKSPVSYPCVFTKKYPDLTGNIYAMYEWGGFLIWQLPKAKVFADGRTPAWLDNTGASTYQVLLAILQTRPGWNEKLTETKTDYILISPGTFMDLLLKENPEKYGWNEDFRDGASVFYKRI
ncbi:MAG: hypothetical protein AAB486_03170 [Patescibacteria group bacterium]